MGFRFQKRVKIFPGVTLNFSKSGVSTSLGVRGARVTVGNGQTRTTVGVPGTGLSYTTTGKTGDQTAAPQPTTEELPSLYLKIILIPLCLFILYLLAAWILKYVF